MPTRYLAHGRLTIGIRYARERFPEAEPGLRAAPDIGYVINTKDPETLATVGLLQGRQSSYQVHRFGPTVEVLDHIGPGGRPEDLSPLSPA